MNKKQKILTVLMLMGLAVMYFAGGCSILPSRSSISQVSSIPSSPASQMWKVVAKSNWVVTICLLGFGAGLFTFFNGNPKLGLAIVFSSLGTLFFGLAVHRFPTWMAIVGLLGAIIGVAASILMKHRAIIEIIKGGQAWKKEMKVGDVNRNFVAVKEFTSHQKEEQSPTTQKLVKKIKNDLKLKGQI